MSCDKANGGCGVKFCWKCKAIFQRRHGSGTYCSWDYKHFKGCPMIGGKYEGSGTITKVGKARQLCVENDTILSLDAEKTALRSEIATKDANLAKKNASIAELENRASVTKRRAEILEASKKGLEGKVKVAEDSWAAAVKETANLKLEVETLAKEVEELRPRIGEQQDMIRASKQELQKAEESLKRERERSADLARKITFVTVEAAKHRAVRRTSKRDPLSRTGSKVVRGASVARSVSKVGP
ncbi:hypothetical protein FKW77_010469 [Venturia effusa]|uniref:Uncharacterized protein n=1 Tax=Venturia effusa TaxID=50376 RepID=A0A517L6H2_9PEZI|nr:hypothetical protein FKW77_010469 [Venturia effusa]